MSRIGKTSVLLALCSTVTAAALTGCTDDTGESDGAANKPSQQVASFTGAKKIKVDGAAVNVSCSGTAEDAQPVVVLLHGGGDSLRKLAGLQRKLGKEHRVCSYDRLGAGASDKPQGKQSMTDTGKILTGVLDKVAGDSPAVLAGHSLGGLIAARYAGDHQDKVAGLVLMDATPPTQSADLRREIPADAPKPAAQLRAQTLAIFNGNSPEKLVIKDGKVRSAGDIPVTVIKHGVQYLAKVPESGPGLEKAWATGQHEWLKLSTQSKLTTAKKSGHYIYLDQPKIAVDAVQQVVAQAKS